MSVTASERLLFVLGKFGLGRLPTVAGEFSPFSPSGQGQRTSSADRARYGKRGTEQQELSPQGLPSKRRADDEDPGQQKATHGAPSRKARKRHAFKPATALDDHEDHGEYDAGKKAERSKQEGKREVDVKTGQPCQQTADSKPYCSPGEAHSDRRADASPPLLHDYLRTRNRMRFSRVGWQNAKYFVIQSMPRQGSAQERRYDCAACVSRMRTSSRRPACSAQPNASPSCSLSRMRGSAPAASKTRTTSA